MKKNKIVFNLIILLFCFPSFACKEEEPKTLYNYKGCTFIGNDVKKIYKSPVYEGYTYKTLAKGTPVKILEWNEEEKEFHVSAVNGLTDGWCYYQEVAFKPDVLSYLDDFVLEGNEFLTCIIERINFEKLSEVNDSVLHLMELPGAGQFDDDFWRDIFEDLYEKIEVNDFENLKGKDPFYFKWIELDARRHNPYGPFSFMSCMYDHFDKVPYLPMGQNQETFMIYAIRNGLSYYFDKFLHKDIDFNIKDKYGKSLFDYAEELGFTDIVNAKGSSNLVADYAEVAACWSEFAPQNPVKKINSPKIRHIYNSPELEVALYDKKNDTALNFFEEEADFNVDENNLSVSGFGISDYAFSVQNQNLITSNKEKIPVSAGESLRVLKRLPYEHSVEVDGKKIKSHFLLVRKGDGHLGMVDAFTLAHISSGGTDWEWEPDGMSAIVYEEKLLLATKFNADKGKDYIGNIYLVEKDFRAANGPKVTSTRVEFDDMLELVNISIPRHQGVTKDNIYLYNFEIAMTKSESGNPLINIQREFRFDIESRDYPVMNNNIFYLYNYKLYHLFTVNAYNTYFTNQKNTICIYAGNEFNDQKELWHFSDVGEVLSHRIFRNYDEYDEYMNKFRDSKLDYYY